MKSYRFIIVGIIVILLLSVCTYFWGTGVMDSLYAYQSPLHANPPAPGEPLGKPLSRRVVFVLVDGLREDTSLKPEVMPFLAELRAQGASASMHSRPPSFSQPGYAVLLTGAWPDLSDAPAMNLDYTEITTFTQDDLVSTVQRAGMKTVLSSNNWLEKLIPQSAVSASFYTSGDDQAADRLEVDKALPWLKDDTYQFVFIHIDQVDYAGHSEGGPRDPRWDAAAHRADDLLREIAATLDLNQDTLFVCSDHGHIDAGGHGGQDPIVLREPFVLAGAGVRPGSYGDVNMVDVAPTLAALLGANIPASTQGRVLTAMLALNPDQIQAVRNATEAQQKQLLEAYQSAIRRIVEPKPGSDVVASYQAALGAARAARLNTERLPRIILALVAALLPAAWLVWRRSKESAVPAVLCRTCRIAWLLAGAILYLLLFNLRYGLLNKRTYSFSSVAGATDLILFCGVTVLMALTIAWLVTSLGLGAFRKGPLQSAELALGLGIVTVYLLMLPVLWSLALNGVFITWTLPDFASLFLAFLSLIQIMMAAAVALLLTGISALIGQFARK